MPDKPKFYWDNANKRYRGTNGRYVSGKTVQAYSAASLSATSQIARDLATAVVKGEMTPSAFEKAMREQIKNEYIRQYMLAKGGRASMTQRDWGRIGRMVKDQYKYLAGFTSELSAGTVAEGSAAMRAAMYINSAEQGFNSARGRNANEWGATEESWNLSVAEHCEDCISFAGEGWKPLDYFPVPGAGKTRCLTNCHCYKSYRDKDGKAFKG